MINWLGKYYLEPHHPVYIISFFMKRYFLQIWAACAILILSYPLVQSILLNQEYDISLTQEYEKKQELASQEKLFSYLLQNRQRMNDKNLSKQNQKIKDILVKQNAIVENIQWNLEQEGTVILIFNQYSYKLFPTVRQILALEEININELKLVKLNHDNLVQVYMQLSFNQMEK